MPALSAYSNVENTSLSILYEKGYKVWYTATSELYYAERAGWDFAASSITELLGVVSIYEFQAPQRYKEYWWRRNEQRHLAEIPTEAPEYEPVWKTHRPQVASVPTKLKPGGR